jgi:hypothetical protein
MTTRDEIETRLVRALAVEPSEDGMRWLDQRVAQIAARPVAIPRRGFFTPRLILRPLVLLAAFVLLTGAVVAGVSLLERILQTSGMPGWQIAWDRGERLGLKRTDAGVTITLERAYADLNQFLIGFTVEGLDAAPTSGHGEPLPLEWRIALRDPSGRQSQEWTPSQGAQVLGQTGISAVVVTWEGPVTPVSGNWELTFTSIGYGSGGMVSGECTAGNTDPACANPPANAMVDGTWRFEFNMPAPAGTVLTPNVSDTAGDATVTLTEFRITPTMITSSVALRVDNQAVAGWGWLNPSVRRGDAAYIFNTSLHVVRGSPDEGPNGDAMKFETPGGTDETAGTWEIVIPELAYGTGAPGSEIQLVGPWTLTVTVPK